MNDIDRIVNRLYEDKVNGELSAERFTKMLTDFETEQEMLKKKCEELRISVADIKTKCDNSKRFINLVKQFTEIPKLTTEIASTLIEKVIVYEAEKGEDGTKIQRVRVIYNLIEDIENELKE